MKKKIVSLVVTYNRKELLRECIKALQNQSVDMDILIVDNGSTDGTEKMIADDFESVLYYNTGKNLGGAGGFHFGIKLAAEKKYDYIWIMDDDTIPSNDALQELVNADELLGGKYGFLASTVYWIDGNACLMNVPGISKKWMDGKSYALLEKGLLGIQHASFVSIFFSRKVVENVGLPIKEFFIWNDDFEYTSRISSQYDCYYVAKSKVCHKMKENMEANIVDDSLERVDRYRMGYRNEYYVIKQKGFEGKAKYYYKICKLCIMILRSDCSHKVKRLRAVLKGVVEGWSFHPVIEKVNF